MLAATPASAGQSGWASVSDIFTRRCVMCHAEHGAQRGLRLDSLAAVLAGSERGPVVVPGDPEASEIMRRLTGASTPRMPFLSVALPEEELAAVRRWIEAGATAE